MATGRPAVRWRAIEQRQPHHRKKSAMSSIEPLNAEILGQFRDQQGASLADLSRGRRLLLVFLRHLGCIFCRQALADLAASRQTIEQNGARIVLVHMQTDQEAGALFAGYGLQDVSRISDPARRLYTHFGLARGGLGQVGGPAVWLPAIKSLFSGTLPGIPKSDIWQLPGVFLLEDGRVLAGHRHQTSADPVDFVQLSRATMAPGNSGRA
jgi:hypothetical protein